MILGNNTKIKVRVNALLFVIFFFLQSHCMLTEKEKEVRFTVAKQDISLALNDICRVVSVKRIVGDNIDLRKLAVRMDANVVQKFPGEATNPETGRKDGARSGKLYRFWKCDIIPVEVLIRE